MSRTIKAPRGILRTAVATVQRYRHDRYPPSRDLERYVEHYWSVRWDLRGLAPERVETLPHPSVHLVFERDGNSRICGVTRGKFVRMLEGENRLFAVKFRPAGFYPFVATSVSSFADRVLTLREVFGAACGALEAAVLAEPEDIARVAVVEEFLRGRRPQLDENVERISDIVYSVMRERGILKVADLAERSGMNTRTLQRLFAKYVGVSPKWVIQRYRLHEAAEQLVLGGSVSQSTLAANLGYSDQAHFVRDFKAVVGTSPRAYARAAKRVQP
jgi:AraC-like DNA-binding protein